MVLKLRRHGMSNDPPRSRHLFEPGPDKPFLVTSGALRLYTREQIVSCLRELQRVARANGGLEYVQVFDADDGNENLWFVEDDGEGAITALLPSEY